MVHTNDIYNDNYCIHTSHKRTMMFTNVCYSFKSSRALKVDSDWLSYCCGLWVSGKQQ